MATVTLRNLSKTYRGGGGSEVTALRDVDLEISNREFVVLVGPAGSGKSTALRIIAGLEESSGGEILIGDRSVKGISSKDRDVAIVVSDDALYPHLSVYENIAFGLRRRKFLEPEIKRRVNDAAAVLGLEQSLTHKPDALSREYQQRVAFGRAIVRQPKVLLLDDPLSQLDAIERTQLRGELARLHQRLETTIIYATRDAIEALTLGDRIVVMDRGIVQQNGTAREVYEQPANLVVARMFGSPAINLLEGMLKQERDLLVFHETGDGTVEARFALADRPGAEEFAGKQVMLGIRPEDIVVQPPSGGKSADGLPGLLDLIEPLGAETIVHLQTGAHRLTGRSGEGAVNREDAGRRVRFKINLAKAHLFDPTTSRRIG